MPVEFLTDERVTEYGRFAPQPSQAELDRFCFFDDADLELIGKNYGQPANNQPTATKPLQDRWSLVRELSNGGWRYLSPWRLTNANGRMVTTGGPHRR